MRRVIASVFLVLVGPAVSAAESPRTAVVADLGLHVVGLGVQRTVAPRVAVQLAVDYYQPWTWARTQTGADPDDVVGVVARGRAFVFLRAAPTGWWLSSFAQGGRGWHRCQEDRCGGLVWAAGASVGHTWRFGNLLFSLGAGAQYHSSERFGGLWPHADIIVGRRF